MSITTDKGLKKRRLEEPRISAAKDGSAETERKSAELKKRKKGKRLKREGDAGLETHDRSEENAVVSGGTSTREGSEGEATQQEEDGGETREERKRRKKQRKEEKRRQRKDSTQPNPSNEHNGVALKPGRRYEQHPDLTAISQAEIDTFLASNSISTADAGAETYRPITKFSQISPNSKEVEIFNEFASPTPVQAATWPYLLAGRDVIGVAETGSGKTLAYGVPLVRHVGSKQMKAKMGIKALVVAPTRELAVQIHEQLEQLVAGTRLRTVCVYGGIPKDHQRPALNISNIVVATPGRLNDFIQEGAADLSEVGLVVLDEADRMLEKGFEEEMRKILGTITTPGRQTAMFTATWPQSIRDLAATFMRNPVRVNIGDAGGDLRANTRVAQRVEVMDPRNKENRLLQLLKQYHTGKSKDDRILVFCLYKKEASRVEHYVRSRGFAVGGIHGDMNQIARMESLDGFRSGKVPLLVATDVAARGLDIPAVKLVINLTFPLTVEDYVHRIGRTGRAGKDGLAITLFTEHEKALSGSLINVLRAAKQPVPDDLLKFGTTVKKKTHEAYGAFYKDMGDAPQKSTKITFD